jgi:glyoxylase-like metal-dependent hydrolase (beta-lactamase superfamily II)
MTTLEFATDLGQGIWLIDTGFQRPQFDAAYLIVQDGRAAFIDCGTNPAVPRLLATLAALGLQPDAVDHLIVTHVHLDHAGGAGLLMQALPRARLVVHPRGARHMIDPTALYQGALAVYGQAEMDASYGRLVPVDAARVLGSHPGMTLHLAGRTLEFTDTPGHARHHHAVWDSQTHGWFVGDTFGLSYREFDVDGRAWIMPTTTPVQFEPEALRGSITGLLARNPRWIYLTHYGRLGEVERLGAALLDGIDQVVALGHALRQAPDRHAALKQGLAALYQRQLAAHGCALPAAEIDRLLGMDTELNAQGMACWLDRPTASPS